MSCDVGKVTERLENELCYYNVDGIGDTPSFIFVKETVVACSTVE